MAALTTYRGTSLLAAALVFAAFACGFGRMGSASAQATPKPTVFEYTLRDVATEQAIDTSNDLGKQGWEIYQAMPVWHFENSELRPTRYVLFAKRPAQH